MSEGSRSAGRRGSPPAESPSAPPAPAEVEWLRMMSFFEARAERILERGGRAEGGRDVTVGRRVRGRRIDG